MYIGGEHILNPFTYFSSNRFNIDNYIKGKHDFKHIYFTQGGFNSLYTILNNLNLKEGSIVLLPSYLCPSIIKVFKILNVKYEFYKINKELKIDYSHLSNIINQDVKAILIINYFGFPVLDSQGINLLNEIKRKGIFVIEDAVHSFYSDIKIVGDFVFNSFRKYLPIDCSILMSHKSLTMNSGKRWNKYFIKRNLGRVLRCLKLNYSIGWEKSYIKLIDDSEEVYNNINNYVNPLSIKLINKYNHTDLAADRNKNYKYMLKNFKESAIFKSINEKISPLGFPIIVKNRNEIREKLRDFKIYCPIHWNLKNEINRSEYEDSYTLSEFILTIPINFTYDIEKLTYLKNKLQEVL